MTSHGSSESCGIKQGTGCSRGLRAKSSQMQEFRDGIDPKRGKQKDRERQGDKEGKERKEKTRRKISERFLLVEEKSTAEIRNEDKE